MEIEERFEDVYYYVGFFKKIYKVDVVSVTRVLINTGSFTSEFKYKYLIKLENGKMKYVDSNKIIEAKQKVYDIVGFDFLKE